MILAGRRLLLVGVLALALPLVVVGEPARGLASGATATCAVDDRLVLARTAPAPGPGPTVVALLDSGLQAAAVPGATIHPSSRSMVSGDDPDRWGDRHGHGSVVATIVYERAPHAELLVLRVLDERGRASVDDLVHALAIAGEAGAHVINLSASIPAGDQRLVHALLLAADGGATVVLAAGNDGLDLDQHAGWDRLGEHPRIVVVAAADEDGRPSARSNHGEQVVDVTVALPERGPLGGTSAAAACTTAAITNQR